MDHHRIYAICFLCILGAFLFQAANISAQTDTFTISASIISNDTSAPSIPQNLTADPVTTHQINVSWSASSDNVSVQGYRVYRDGVFIATTSVADYSDTGLAAATTYAYTVDAFDAALNFSAQSATTSATTLAPTNQDDRNERDRSSRRTRGTTNEVSSIAGLEIDMAERSAVLTWSSDDYVRTYVYWGESIDYESGSISGVAFQKYHEIKIENLDPGTFYNFKIEMEDFAGGGVVYEGSFMTLFSGNALPPPAVFLTVESEDDTLVLRWNEAGVRDDNIVRVVRSTKFFPVDPYDGKMVFQGSRGDTFIDKDVVGGVTYYYSLFVLDENEQYSSGSTAKGELYVMSSGDIFADIPYSGAYENFLSDLTLTDFEFIQKGQKISFAGGGLKLQGEIPTTVRLDAAKIPLGIKAITITFVSHEGQESEPLTFLLRLSPDKQAYEATVVSFMEGGEYEVEINIFDTDNNRVKTLYVVADVDVRIPEKAEQPSLAIRVIRFLIDNLIVIAIFLFVGFMIGRTSRKL